MLEARPQDSTLVVAELDGLGVVGLAYAHPASNYFTHETHGHLGITSASPPWRWLGKGVGRALLDAERERADATKTV